MALHDSVNTMKKLLTEICENLDKSAAGNKAAAQRVRITTIQFEKVAKKYRKESIAEGKKGKKRAGGKKKAGAKKAARKKAPAKKKVARRRR
jgi:Histone H1-like protein Hc1